MSTPVEKVAVASLVAGSATSTSSGLWLWLAENHSQIATLCGLGGLAVAIIGLGVNTYYQRKRSQYPWRG